MKTSVRELTFFCLVGLLLAIFARPTLAGGHGVGNGGDIMIFETSKAWFENSGQAIRICYQLSPDFGASDTQVQAAITNAFDAWASYLHQKRLDFVLSLSTQPDLLPSCDGTQDLTFYMGVNTTETDTAKKEYLDPMAFAYEDYSQALKIWGQGLIWVQSIPEFWSQPDAMTAILIHELGHVLGCDHVSGTIMDADIISIVSGIVHPADGQPVRTPLAIDRNKELYSCSDCDFSYSGSQSDANNSVFSLLSGHAPKASVSLTLVQRNGIVNLQAFDGTTAVSAQLDIHPNPIHFDVNACVFRSYMNILGGTNDIPVATCMPSAQGSVSFGTFKDSGGKLRSVRLYRNSAASEGPITIRYIDDSGAEQPLFESFF